MRTPLVGVLAVLVALTVLPRSEAQTKEMQDAIKATLSDAKPAPKSGDKAEAKPLVVPAIDYLDFVFVANDRPVLLRLHMQNNNRPYTAAWDDYMKKFFDYFDKNGDGKLTKVEVERAPNAQFLNFHLQGSLGFPIQGQMVRITDMDENKDGTIQLPEFKNYYKRGGIGPLQFSNGLNAATTDTVTKTVFKYLDTNKDKKLSAEEMSHAAVVLQKLDLDENEMITSDELMPGGGNNSPYGFAVAYNGGMSSPDASLGFIQVEPANMERVAQQVLTHYDKDKDGKLTQTECGFDKALFEKLDSNHDGKLDAKEFVGFVKRDSDLELIARIGKQQVAGEVSNFLKKIGLNPTQMLRVEVYNPNKRAMAMAGKVQRHEADAVTFDFGDSHIDMQASDQGGQQFTNLKQFYTQQFTQADTMKKGVMDKKKAETVDFLRDIFPLADHDNDGKLTRKELDAYLDMQVAGANSKVQLSITDEGRSLFDVLDADSDSRLSIRELRTAWTRMQPLAKSELGLARKDIPRRLQVTVGQAQRFFRPSLVPGRNAKPVAKKPGPMWFGKMDRNSDGDISPREFIGSDEDFVKLDVDGDKLISSEEAHQFEAKLKKSNPKSEAKPNPKSEARKPK